MRGDSRPHQRSPGGCAWLLARRARAHAGVVGPVPAPGRPGTSGLVPEDLGHYSRGVYQSNVGSQPGKSPRHRGEGHGDRLPSLPRGIANAWSPTAVADRDRGSSDRWDRHLAGRLGPRRRARRRTPEHPALTRLPPVHRPAVTGRVHWPAPGGFSGHPAVAGRPVRSMIIHAASARSDGRTSRPAGTEDHYPVRVYAPRVVLKPQKTGTRISNRGRHQGQGCRRCALKLQARAARRELTRAKRRPGHADRMP